MPPTEPRPPIASRRRLIACAALAGVSGAVRAQASIVDSEGRPAGAMDAPYIPTSPEVVLSMLDLAEVTARDVVYDLGCGDGRIVIEAARARGARGLGVDIDWKLIETARVHARQAGVADRVRFEQRDVFATDISQASVVMLYLGVELSTRLWPKLARELKPGSRVVSHRFAIRDVAPRRTVEAHGVNLYLWTIG